MEGAKMKKTVEKVYEFIIQFIMANNYSPTVREIGDGIGLKSTSSVYCHLNKLKRKGKINYIPESPRTITVPGYKYVKEEPEGQKEI